MKNLLNRKLTTLNGYTGNCYKFVKLNCYTNGTNILHETATVISLLIVGTVINKITLTAVIQYPTWLRNYQPLLPHC